MGTPGLKRIILLNTHIPGKLAELRLDGHANLSGTNGAGKTTLLKLIPFFYGSEPARLCPQVAGRSSFVDHYLPHDKSFIVYEYANTLGLRCVVVYRHSSNLKPAFRFVSGPFSHQLLIREEAGKQTAISSKELVRHLTELRVPHSSRQIETVLDYRAVLLNQRQAIEQSPLGKELRQMVYEYSLSPRRGIYHLEKITESILDRREGIERVKQMLAEIMRDEGVDITPVVFSKDARKVIDNLSTLREFSKHQKSFHQVISDALAYTEVRSELNEAACHLGEWNRLISDDLVKLTKELAAHSENKSEIKAAWETRELTLNSACNQHASVVKQKSGEIDALHCQYEKWERLGVEQMKVELDQLPHLLDEEMPAAKQRLDDLSSVAADAEKEYLANEKAARGRLDKVLAQIQLKEQDVRAAETEIQERQVAEVNRIRAALSLRQDAARAAAAPLHTSLQGQIAEARLRGKQTFYTPEEEVALAAAEQACNDRRIALDQAGEAVTAQQRTSGIAEQLNQEAIATEQSCTQQLKEAENTLQRLVALRQPEKGTLLSKFREQDPEWHKDIAKVINPSLLQRKDLSPEFLRIDRSLYGWQLDLDVVNKPDHALDFETYSRQIETQEYVVENARGRLEKANVERGQAEDSWRRAQQSLAQANRELATATTAHKAAVQSQRNVTEQIRADSYKRREAAQNEAKQLERQLEEALRRLEAELRSLKEQADQDISDVQGSCGLDLDRKRQEREALELQKQSVQEGFRSECRQLEVIKRQRLSDQGIDEGTIAAAERVLHDLKEKITRLSGYRNPVSQYENWLSTHWSQKDRLNAELADAREALGSAIAQRELETQAHGAELERISRAGRELQARQQALNQDKSTVERLLQRMGVSGDISQVSKPLPAILLLEQDVTEALERIRVLDGKIIRGIGQAESIIIRRDRTPVAEAWQQECQVLQGKDYTPSQTALAKAGFLDRLLAEHLPQIRNSMLQELEILGLGLARLHETMASVQAKVQQQSHLVSQSIQSLAAFDAIGGIEISLVSRIDKLDYWPLLKQFMVCWEAWAEREIDELPDSQFELALSDALGAVLAAREQRSIDALFDLEIHVTENGRPVRITNDRDMRNVSSGGLTYLISCAIYAGITHMLCRQGELKVHWPVDELGTLAPENIVRLFAMLDASHVVMVSGFPTTEPALLRHFPNKHYIKQGQGVVDIEVEEDALAQAMKRRRSREGTAHV